MCMLFFCLCVCLHSAEGLSWLAMEWCWLQTGWQGLQGGQGHTILKQQQQQAFSKCALAGSDSALASDLLPLLVSVHIYFPFPFLPSSLLLLLPASSLPFFCPLKFFFSFCYNYTWTFFTGTLPLLFEFLWSLTSHWVQYELVEQVEPTGPRESVQSECRPL